ncbi:MAG TPA: 50S ribosomal protein L10 [Pyrinomonadaceae bacterium]|nr:50S ribosomal protein L10 [Pyrinomonadaceae bacterium]
MKTKETKQRDLAALTESLATSTSAMVVSFSKLTVTKDQEFRNSLRDAGASYQVVKNTLARIAVKGTQFEDATEHFKGVTAIAWTQNDPVVLSKAISKFMKDNADIYTFKTGVVEGKLVDLKQLTTIANLPSKEELISQLLWVLLSGAQRLVTVINAVPRDLAVVIKQIGEQEGRAAGTPPGQPVEAAPAAPPQADETTAVAVEEAPAAESVESAPVEAAPAAESETVETTPELDTSEQTTEIEEEAVAGAPDDAAAEASAEPPLETPEAATESLEEGAAAAPDDQAEALLESPPESAGDKAE